MDDDSKNAWMRVGLHFAAAGDKLKTHAKAVAEEAKGSDEDQAAITDALNTLGKAMNQAVKSVGNAVQDQEARDSLTPGLNAMGAAMNPSFRAADTKVGDRVADVGAKVSDKVKDTFGRKG